MRGLAFNVVSDPVAGYFYKQYILGQPQEMASVLGKTQHRHDPPQRSSLRGSDNVCLQRAAPCAVQSRSDEPFRPFKERIPYFRDCGGGKKQAIMMSGQKLFISERKQDDGSKSSYYNYYENGDGMKAELYPEIAPISVNNLSAWLRKAFTTV